MEQGMPLVWVDLEMTGLKPERDVILEMACIITDSQLTVLAESPTLVIHQPDSQLSLMDNWVMQTHTTSGLVKAVQESNLTVSQVQDRMLDFIRSHVEHGKSLLCGNSIWQDRSFLVKYMPQFINYLHYRIVDVTTIKELVKRWYPDDEHALFVKQNSHRAIDDIKESIAELKHFKKYFFV